MNYRAALCFCSSSVLLAAETYACGRGIADDSLSMMTYLGGGTLLFLTGATFYTAGIRWDVRSR